MVDYLAFNLHSLVMNCSVNNHLSSHSHYMFMCSCLLAFFVFFFKLFLFSTCFLAPSFFLYLPFSSFCTFVTLPLFLPCFFFFLSNIFPPFAPPVWHPSLFPFFSFLFLRSPLLSSCPHSPSLNVYFLQWSSALLFAGQS